MDREPAHALERQDQRHAATDGQRVEILQHDVEAKGAQRHGPMGWYRHLGAPRSRVRRREAVGRDDQRAADGIVTGRDAAPPLEPILAADFAAPRYPPVGGVLSPELYPLVHGRAQPCCIASRLLMASAP